MSWPFHSESCFFWAKGYKETSSECYKHLAMGFTEMHPMCYCFMKEKIKKLDQNLFFCYVPDFILILIN